MDLKLAGKSVIVLGAATKDNMAQGIARAFIDEGAKVMVAGRKRDVLEAFAADTGCAWALCDITKKAEIDALVDKTVETFGRVDVGINAAANGLMKPFLDTTPEELETMSAVQFVGAFQFFQALVRAMVKSGGGSIIQITSATAKIMLEDHSPYRGTKAAADQVIRSIAHEFGKQGIRANSVAPGLTDSPMAAAAYAVPAIIDLFNRETAMGRTGRIDDIAAACLFAASDLCFMTGQTFQVNGGVTLGRNPTKQEMIDAATAGMAQAAE
jgi:2-hydroxycyclohexanecarboxyl-CoA dehydrogenase